MNSSPSSACKAAVATLQEFEDANILAWTKLLRSFTPTLGLRPNQEVLSSKELDALSTLRHYPDEAVIAWLRNVRQGKPHHHPRPIIKTDDCFKKTRIKMRDYALQPHINHNATPRKTL